MNRVLMVGLVGLASIASALAYAQANVSAPWVRGTVAGQKATGAYMLLMSDKGAVLVGAESPAANIVEIHEMRMEENVMKMRPIPRLELPAGKTVELKPGGYHVMLIDLKKPLAKGDTVPIRLRLEDRDRTVRTVDVMAEVRDLAAPAGMSKHGHKSH